MTRFHGGALGASGEASSSLANGGNISLSSRERTYSEENVTYIESWELLRESCLLRPTQRGNIAVLIAVLSRPPVRASLTGACIRTSSSILRSLIPFPSMFLRRSFWSVAARLRWGDAVRSLGVLLIVGLGLMACDSNGGGPPPSDLEGTYVFEELRFTVAGVDNFNILRDTLVTDTSGADAPRIEFFGGDATVDLIYRLEGSDGRSRIPGQFTTGRGRVTVDFSEASKKDRFEILLPPVVRLQRQDDGARLVADQEVRKVDLKKYSPGRYGGLTQKVNGTLRMELTRVSE